MELAAKLEYENIARIYESGLRHGLCYYAMELVDGVHLDDGEAEPAHVAANSGIDENRLPGCTACPPAWCNPQGSQAIQYHGQQGRAATRSGFRVGQGRPGGGCGINRVAGRRYSWTLPYMSPEQAAGRVTEIDTRSGRL